VKLEQDVYEAAKALAEASGESLGTALSKLARRGLERPPSLATKKRGGFPVVQIPRSSPPVTAEAVRRALEED